MRLWFHQQVLEPERFSPEASPDSGSGFRNHVARFLDFWYSDQPYWEAQTSGSTSEPKKIRISRTRMLASAQATLDYFQWKPNSHGLVLCLSPLHVGGFMVLVRALLGNLDLLLLEPSLLPFPQSGLPGGLSWFASLVPAQLHTLLSQNHPEQFCKHLDGILIGGADLSPETIPAITNLPCSVYQTYGMTETVSHIALRKIHPNILPISKIPYQTLPGVRIRTSGEGQLQIQAPVTENQWISTKDQVEMENESSFFFRTRTDRFINTGGIKADPVAIRNSLLDNPNLPFRDLEVTGLPHPKWGQQIVAVIFGAPPPDPLQAKEAFSLALQEETNPNSRRSFPGKVFYLPLKPLTTSGKTDFPEIQRSIQNLSPLWERDKTDL